MESRTAALIIAALAVCCAGLVLSVAYPFTLREPHAANPSEERFTVPEPATYDASGRIVADGETALGVTAVRTDDGTRYRRVREPGVVSETYQADATATVHRRVRIADPDHAAGFRQEVRDDPDRTLRQSDRADGWTTFVVAENASRPVEPITGAPSVVVRSLHVAAYERTDGAGTAAGTTYAPRGGWYEGRTGYRLTDATGTVETAGESYAVVSADVSWTVTRPADTYAAYALARLTGGDVLTQRLTLEVAEDPDRVERPDWVPDSGSGGGAGGGAAS